MSNPARVPIRLHPALAWSIIAFCLATIVWLISFSPWPMIPFRIAGQAWLILVILFAFRYWPPMVRLVLSMPVAHRVVFGVLIAGMITGHYTLNGRTYFPYVNWAIFPNVDNANPVTSDEFVATTQAGHKVRLLPEQLFPSIVQIDRVEDIQNSESEASGYYPAGTTEKLAHALAQAYNEHHPADPVWRVDLMRLSVQLHPPADESRANPSCELLKRYDISSGQ